MSVCVVLVTLEAKYTPAVCIIPKTVLKVIWNCYQTHSFKYSQC